MCVIYHQHAVLSEKRHKRQACSVEICSHTVCHFHHDSSRCMYVRRSSHSINGLDLYYSIGLQVMRIDNGLFLLDSDHFYTLCICSVIRLSGTVILPPHKDCEAVSIASAK